jgi:hypothetical protein
MKFNSKKYQNIETLSELVKICDGIWYAYGKKLSYSTSATGKTKYDALRKLDNHLSYVIK